MAQEMLSLSDSARAAIQEETEKTFALIGGRIRKLRQARRMTIQQLAAASEMSASMLSLVERGLTSPSLLSLTAISHSLGLSLVELMSGQEGDMDETITRFAETPAIETPDGILRRVLRDDRKRGVKITYSDYGPNIGNSPVGITHRGFEYGLVLEGTLTIEIDGVPTVLRSGDLVSLKSTRLHKIWNYGRKRATTLWFNIEDDTL